MVEQPKRILDQLRDVLRLKQKVGVAFAVLLMLALEAVMGEAIAPSHLSLINPKN
jgi:hypothetical protein